MTRFILLNDRIFDLSDGSLEISKPSMRFGCHDVWSAEALLDELATIDRPTELKPFHFVNVIE